VAQIVTVLFLSSFSHPSVTDPSGILGVTVVYRDPAEHCCQDSSDEDSLRVERPGHAAPPRKARTADGTGRVSACVASRNAEWEGTLLAMVPVLHLHSCLLQK